MKFKKVCGIVVGCTVWVLLMTACVEEGDDQSVTPNYEPNPTGNGVIIDDDPKTEPQLEEDPVYQQSTEQLVDLSLAESLEYLVQQQANGEPYEKMDLLILAYIAKLQEEGIEPFLYENVREKLETAYEHSEIITENEHYIQGVLYSIKYRDLSPVESAAARDLLDEIYAIGLTFEGNDGAFFPRVHEPFFLEKFGNSISPELTAYLKIREADHHVWIGSIYIREDFYDLALNHIAIESFLETYPDSYHFIEMKAWFERYTRSYFVLQQLYHDEEVYADYTKVATEHPETSIGQWTAAHLADSWNNGEYMPSDSVENHLADEDGLRYYYNRDEMDAFTNELLELYWGE